MGGGARRAHPDMEVRVLLSPSSLSLSRFLCVRKADSRSISCAQQPGSNNEWQNSMFG